MKGGVKKFKVPVRSAVLIVVNSLQCFQLWTLQALIGKSL